MLKPIRPRPFPLRRALFRSCCAVLTFLLAALLSFPGLRNELFTLMDRVLDASEAANRYLYHFRFTASPAPDTSAAFALSLVALSLVLALACLSRSRLPALLLALGLAASQAYLGLSLPVWANVGCFAVLAMRCVCVASFKTALPFACCLLLLTLAFLLLFPGANPTVESASETVRDWLGAVQSQPHAALGDAPPEVLETRHENRRDLTFGVLDASPERSYRLVTVDEKLLALPHWVDYLRIVLLCLLVPTLLLLPFLPFVWMARRRAQAEEKLSRAISDDAAQSVRAAFSLVIGYLDACGVGDKNALFSRRLDAPLPSLPEDYSPLYRRCAAVWQDTVYGGRIPAAHERELLLQLLSDTERIFYDQADLRTRLRLRFVFCLHE